MVTLCHCQQSQIPAVFNGHNLSLTNAQLPSAPACKHLMKLSGFRKRQSPSRSSVLTGSWSSVFIQTYFPVDRPNNSRPESDSGRSMQHTEFFPIRKGDQPTTLK